MTIESFVPAENLDVGKILVIQSDLEIVRHHRQLLGRFEAPLGFDILQLFASRNVGYLIFFARRVKSQTMVRLSFDSNSIAVGRPFNISCVMNFPKPQPLPWPGKAL